MIWYLGETVVWLLAAILAGAITFAVISILTGIFRGRAHELRASREALEEYERLFKLLMDDPVTPESVRLLLTEFDRGVMHRGAAHFIATSIFREHGKWLETAREPKVIMEMRKIGQSRPDLYEAFINAIGKGFIATMLRWFFSACAFRFLLVDPRRDPVTPARVMVSAAEKRGSHASLLAAA